MVTLYRGDEIVDVSADKLVWDSGLCPREDLEVDFSLRQDSVTGVWLISLALYGVQDTEPLLSIELDIVLSEAHLPYDAAIVARSLITGTADAVGIACVNILANTCKCVSFTIKDGDDDLVVIEAILHNNDVAAAEVSRATLVEAIEQ